MKSYQLFLLFWLLPFIIFIPVIVLDSNHSFWSVLNSKITFFTLIYFAIISFTNVRITRYLESFRFKEKNKILLSSLSCFVFVFIFSIGFQLIYQKKINLFPPFFQGLVAIGVFLIEYFMVRLFNNEKESNLDFSFSKFFYVKLLLFVFFVDFLFIFLLTFDTFINLKLLDYYDHIKFFIPYLISVVILSFFGILFSNKLKINTVIKVVLVSIFTFLILQIFNIVKYRFHFGLVLNFFMISLFSTCMIYGLLYYFKQKKSIGKLKLQNIQKDAQYKELKNQINPHFLFNNLNTLISFIEVNPTKAIDFGHNLANVYRYYLQNQKDDFVLLHDELLFINEYLEIYKAKFERSFDFSIQKNCSKNQYILSFSIQELIDNIFKHNNLDENSLLNISIYIENEYLIVSNNLLPKLSAYSNNSGLNNINKRYELLTNTSIIISKNDDSFKVKLPILNLE